MTIAEVAEMAGVSVATVSKVLNDRPGVGDLTREKVQLLLAEHDYVRRASRPSEPDSGLIDVLLDNVGSLWQLEMLAGVAERLSRQRLSLVITPSQGSNTSEVDVARWVDQIAAHRSEGVLLSLWNVNPVLQRKLSSYRLPFVAIDAGNVTGQGIPTIGPADFASARTATEHLLGLGHRRIALIGGPSHLACAHLREDGFLAAMRRADIPVPAWATSNGPFSTENGARSAYRLLTRDDRPTAIFAASDLQASGVYETCRALGLRIPEDLSVVGFDDLPIASWLWPALTTVRQPIREMARTAVDMLVEMIAGRPPTSTRVELAAELVVRASSAPPVEPSIEAS